MYNRFLGAAVRPEHAATRDVGIMSGGFPFIDIVLFAALALFLVYRLSTVLGRRGDDNERRADQASTPSDSNEEDGDNVVELPGPGDRGVPADELESSDPLTAGLARVRKVDPSFQQSEFLKGAGQAFEMVVAAFAEGNGKVLKSLLDGPVYENFAAAIREREKAGHTLETTLVGIEKSEIIGADLQDRRAQITVKFISGQVNATTDADGEIVEGDASHVVQVTDIWTFQRDTRSSNPNWVLGATGNAD